MKKKETKEVSLLKSEIVGLKVEAAKQVESARRLGLALDEAKTAITQLHDEAAEHGMGLTKLWQRVVRLAGG